jgi:hypothetical protein
MNPFTGAKMLKWIFLDLFNFGDVTKKEFFALSDVSISDFEKICSTKFAN